MREATLALAVVLLSRPLLPLPGAEAERPRKVVLIAGPLDKSHPPGTHEYEKSVRLLAYCLDHSPNLRGVRTEVHLGGWPGDPRTLDDADTIVLVSSGSDRREEDHPLLVGDRLAVVERQMKRGCGLVLIHWATFAPKDKLGSKLLEWVGGYFDYETGPPPRGWYSKIQVATTRARPGSPRHPLCAGLEPFELREEYYYRIRFRERDPRLVPVLVTPLPGERDEQVVAWAVERQDGGRGFGFTGGHFFDNWKVEHFRRMVLNAIVWTAKAEVPEGGVRSRLPTEEELSGVAAGRPLVPGKFGQGLDARRRHAEVEYREAYQQPPLTVECWAKLDSARGHNLLVAGNVKESSSHWEVFTMPGSGHFTAYLPGRKPDHVRTEVNICDGKWHHLAMQYEAERVRLYVDGKQAADVRVAAGGGEAKKGPLWLGAYPPQGLGCDGIIDEVRISRGVRAIEGIPEQAPDADADTLGLWHLDAVEEGRSPDASKGNNPARIGGGAAAPKPAAGPGSRTELDYRPADPRLRAILLDRSPDESYVAIKADTQGRLFVGGREGLFVFEPDSRGGYGPRRELFRFPPDSWVAGIEVRGNDLYVLTAAALYVFPEGRTRREGLAPRRLVWGLPLDLHVSFHCLAWGPEGDLYLNHGDPLLNYGDFSRPDHWGHWTIFSADGARTPYTGAGGVFRVRPDGSHFRCVAGGLRGPFGLAFDRRWDLFTNDNDHESRPDLYTPARLLHVTPQIDFGWPRGWIASKLPDRRDLVEAMHNIPGRGVPVGLACYDEPLFPPEYRHCLLQARWDLLAVQRHTIQKRGASYSSTESPFLVGKGQARPVGVAVGRGGRVFVAVAYMAGNEASPHYVSDLVMVTTADDRPEHPFEPYDAVTATPAKLFAELSQPSWERRRAAHVEILRRGGDLLDEAARRLVKVTTDDPAILHLPWLAGAGGSPAAAKALDYDLHLVPDDYRLQVLRVLAEFSALEAPPSVFAAALRDEDPRLRLEAMAAFFDPARELPFAAVMKPSWSTDTYLRQTATKLLARRARLEDIVDLMRSEDAAVRLTGVLAAGFRLTVPPPHSTPPKEVALFYPKANPFFHTAIRYGDRPAEAVELDRLGRVGSYTTAEMWKAITPTPEQKTLFDLLSGRLTDSSEVVRLQAAYFLSLLRDPRTEPAVARVFAEVRERRLADVPVRDVGKAWSVGPFAADEDGPEVGPIDLSAEYTTAIGKTAWHEVEGKEGVFILPRAEGPRGTPGHYLFFRLQSATRQPVLLTAQAGFGVKVWVNGRPVEDRGAEISLDVQPGSNDVLLRGYATGDKVTLRYRGRAGVVATLPEKVGGATLAQRLREGAGKEETVPADFLAIDWVREARKGNAEQGRKLFGSLGCVKCHAITADQAGGGAPSLADAGKRFTVPHLVESILLPGKQVAEPFRATVLTLKKGQTLSGLVVGETAEQIELLQSDTTRKTVAKKDVEERARTAVSPMPAGLVRTPRELQDLLAYLLGPNPLPP